jgi:N,N'-diacetyllegionaminate synthase
MKVGRKVFITFQNVKPSIRRGENRVIWEELISQRPERPKVQIIAEAGVNHNGDLDLAVALLEEAVKTGADAVKFQAFLPEEMTLPRAGKAGYQRDESHPDEDQYQMLKRLQLSAGDLKLLIRKAAGLGIHFLASVFDEKSAEELQELGAAAFKIPSGEITNLPLLVRVASYAKPVLISTGMAWLGEIEDAVSAALGTGNRRLLLLHCVSGYPAPCRSLNLKVLSTLKRAFNLSVGYSDHSEGAEAAVAAVALGAVALEKHFTLDKKLPGPDHQASLNPEEFRKLVESVRKTEAALGDGRKTVADVEWEIRALTRKSIVANTRIERHSIITGDMIGLKRPGSGIAPKFLPDVLGARAARTIPRDTPLCWTDVVPAAGRADHHA